MIGCGPLIYFLGFGAYLIASNLKNSVNKVLQSQNGWKYKCSGFSSSFLVASRSSTDVWGEASLTGVGQASLSHRCVGEASAGVRGGLPPGFLQSQSALRLLLILFPTLLLSIVIDISMTLPGSVIPGAGTDSLVIVPCSHCLVSALFIFPPKNSNFSDPATDVTHFLLTTCWCCCVYCTYIVS